MKGLYYRETPSKPLEQKLMKKLVYFRFTKRF